jgi:uncharacterized protein (AIM24 family)
MRLVQRHLGGGATVPVDEDLVVLWTERLCDAFEEYSRQVERSQREARDGS